MYLVLLNLNITKTAIYYEVGMTTLKLWEQCKLYYTDMNSFILQVKSENVYADLAENIEKRFDT